MIIPNEAVAQYEYYITNKDYKYNPNLKSEPRIRYAAKEMNGRVLDMACNDGTLAELVTSKVEEYFGIELNRQVLSLATAKKIGNANFLQGCSEILPFVDNCFTSVFAGEILEHVPLPELLLKEVWRVLNFNGVCVLTTPVRYPGFKPNPAHLREYLPNEIVTLIQSSGFRVIDGFLAEVYPGRWTTVLKFSKSGVC